MKKGLLYIVLFTLSASAVFPRGSQETGGFSGNYAFGGSTTVEPVALAAIDVFEERYGNLNISYDSQGSSVGVQGVIEGTYTLGGASRDLKDKEKEQGAAATPVALDGVAAIVNKGSVTIDNISLENLAKVFAGEITNWSEMGGPDREIVVFNRDEASGTRSCFDDSVVKSIDLKFTNSAAIVTSNGDMVAKVGSTPYSIGYCGFGYIDRDPDVKPVSVDGVNPSEKNVLNDTYKVSRKLNIIHRGELKPGTLEKAFVEFLLSDDGQAIAGEEGFIPIQ